ncbi:ArsR/SmtB family transcription factor [Vibrio splendidus]|uniref:ArsR/SmtB family transcription factor n=1 Tax=Vibrio splendidus TaxID=29497 RepID=UPI003D0FEB56
MTSRCLMNIEDMRVSANDTAEFLKSMAHPERLMVLCQLTEGELGFTELLEGSCLSQSAFSQQLAVLKRKGLVKVRKESQLVFYSLADSRVELLMSSLHNVFCQHHNEEK